MVLPVYSKFASAHVARAGSRATTDGSFHTNASTNRTPSVTFTSVVASLDFSHPEHPESGGPESGGGTPTRSVQSEGQRAEVAREGLRGEGVREVLRGGRTLFPAIQERDEY